MNRKDRRAVNAMFRKEANRLVSKYKAIVRKENPKLPPFDLYQRAVSLMKEKLTEMTENLDGK